MQSFFSPDLLIGFFAGVLLGFLYFQGLWWSVSRLNRVKNRKMFLFISWLGRSAVLFGGLYLAARYDYRYLLSAFIGLIAVRTVIIRRVKKQINLLVKKTELKEAPGC